MDTMPQAMKMEFVPYIESLFPAMLMSITGEKDQNEELGELDGGSQLSFADCSNKATRERVLLLILLARFDADASVKRVANGLWKTAGGAPKVQKAIMPNMTRFLERLRGGDRGPGAQKLALEAK
eukprot:g23226.t1